MSDKIIDINVARKRKEKGKGFNRVYQLEIYLKNSKPLIWRRIQVPETYTFWDLHVAIQDAMGWYNCHLHEFCIYYNSVTIGIPDDDTGYAALNEREEKISDYFIGLNDICNYNYDFGNYWEHEIVFENIRLKDKDRVYPLCLNGKMACPPEDCGGIWGYNDLLEILKNPGHEDYKDYIEWLGGEYNPEKFDPENVVFTDPDQVYDHCLL